MESQAETIREFWTSKFGADGVKEWVDRVESRLDQKLRDNAYLPNLDDPELLLVIDLMFVDHPSYAARLPDAQLDALRLRYLCKGWHLAGIDKKRGILHLGVMRRPIRVTPDAGIAFDALYQDGMTARELAEHLGNHGAWRYVDDRAEFIPARRIRSVSMSPGSMPG